MNPQRDNIKAGIFVAVAIVLAVLFIFSLADFGKWFEPTQKIRVYYALGDGLKGLKVGATMTLGDVPVGSVTAIDDSFERAAGDTADAPPRLVGKIVTASIPQRYQLYTNAIIELKKPPLGSGTELNIRSVGFGDIAEADHQFAGGLAVSQIAVDFVQEMGIREAQRQHLRQIIANAASLTTTLKDDLPGIMKNANARIDQLEPVLSKAEATMAELQPAAADLRAAMAEMRKRSDAWFDRIDNITASADDALARIDKLLADKDPDLRASVENIKAITKQVREQMLEQIAAALTKADKAVANLEGASNDLKGLMASQRPMLERTLANARLMSDQLKLTAIEVRRAPWRLLYAPTDDELETDNLYDAARSFAQAAGALDSAAAGLAALSKDQRTDPAQMQRMLTDLDKLFGKFKDVEKRFWDELEDRKP